MEEAQLNCGYLSGEQSETLRTLYQQEQSTFLTLRDWIAKLFTGGIGFLLAIDRWVAYSPKLIDTQRLAIAGGVLLISGIAVYAGRTNKRL